MFERRPILFFDSGIGGLSVLRQARLLMPQYRFLYIMDKAGFPYGDWEEEALRARLLELFADWLKKYDPALCVLACNTASTLALEDLRGAFPGRAFVGTVPAIKPAAENSASKRISVLATPGTVKRAYTQELIRRYAGDCAVELVGSRRLAAIAEDYLHGRPVDLAAVKAEIAPCFIDEGGRRTDIIVLACTHYPFLVPIFQNLAPWPVDWLDPAEAIARRVHALLAEGQTGLMAESAADGGKPWPDDYVLSTDKSRADFITERLFHAFGLKFRRRLQ